MNEIALSNDLNVIAIEINTFKKVAGESIFEIGRRLKHVKENDLVHGQWEKWCSESVNITKRHADRYIKVYKTFANGTTSSHLGFEVLYLMSTMTEEERESLQEIPSTGETKTVYEMTVRELREVKQKLKEEQEQKETFKKLYSDEQNKDPIIKEVIPETIKKKLQELQLRNGDLEKYKNEIQRLKSEADLLKKKAQLNDKEAKEYAELKSKIEFLTLEKSNLHREIKSTTELAGLAVKIDNLLKTELAPIRYSRVLEQMENEIAIKNLSEILDSVDSWSYDMRKYLPKKNRIEVEEIR
jgi:hypothetical protein